MRSGLLRRRYQGGTTLLEIVVALAIGAILMALVGSLFVASLSLWRRGSDMREAQAHAGILAELITRDVRDTNQAQGVTLSPHLPPYEGAQGEAVLLVASGAPDEGGTAWILYAVNREQGAVTRSVLAPGPDGSLRVRSLRTVATGVERIDVRRAGPGVVAEIEVRRGREVATARATAAPRNP